VGEVQFNNSLASYLTHVLVDTRNTKYQVKRTVSRLLHLNTHIMCIYFLNLSTLYTRV
jgi:hypothetical protein